ncbi:MAG: Crp/Fnr family transcriptional regulator [Anaerolineales bacterium]|jgi:CRP-like cAMP-binding protein
MVSPELLRRYPFFALLDEQQLEALAMITQEKSYPKGALLVKENTPASIMALLIEGDIDLIYSGGGEGAISNALVGSIAPGEPYGVSSLIEPYRYTATAKATLPVKVLELDGLALRAMVEKDPKMGCIMMRNVAIAVLERLRYTQVELAAARA